MFTGLCNIDYFNIWYDGAYKNNILMLSVFNSCVEYQHGYCVGE